MTTALEGGEGLASRPGHSLPRERQEAGWVPGPVWTGAKNLAPPGFDPRIVQLVASRHTDYVNRPTVQVQFYSFFNLGARWGGWSTPLPSHFTPEKDLVPLTQEAAWAPAPVCTGAENLASTGFDPRIVQPVASRYTD